MGRGREEDVYMCGYRGVCTCIWRLNVCCCLQSLCLESSLNSTQCTYLCLRTTEIIGGHLSLTCMSVDS